MSICSLLRGSLDLTMHDAGAVRRKRGRRDDINAEAAEHAEDY
jgi:hypothetical protein